MIKKFYYKIYGFTVESNIEMKELIAVDDEDINKADIAINLEKLPESIKTKIKNKGQVYISNNEAWFSIDYIGTFYIQNRRKVIIEAIEGVDINKLKLYILGTTMGICLIQNHRVAIHGSSVLLKGGAVIITGDMGAGKSTLTSALLKDEGKLIADDISVLTINNEEIYVTHGYPRQKLCNDAIKMLGYDAENYELIDENREKYTVPINEKFILQDSFLQAIIKIEVIEDGKLELKKLRGKEKLDLLLSNIYRKEVFKYIDIPPEYFKVCISTCENTPIYIMRRPRCGVSVDDEVSLLRERLNIWI